MQVVIDIPKDAYEYIVHCGYVSGQFNIISAIKQGTALPENHGRLIDADELAKKPWFDIDLNENDAPTLLEADYDYHGMQLL